MSHKTDHLKQSAGPLHASTELLATSLSEVRSLVPFILFPQLPAYKKLRNNMHHQTGIPTDCFHFHYRYIELLIQNLKWGLVCSSNCNKCLAISYLSHIRTKEWHGNGHQPHLHKNFPVPTPSPSALTQSPPHPHWLQPHPHEIHPH